MDNRFFTGNLDADRLILMEVDDRELFSICIPKKKEDTYSKYAQKLCNEDFFRNRTLSRFPWTVREKEKEGDLSWKKFYASSVYYISQMEDKRVMEKFGYEPFDGVKYQGNPKKQYNFFKNHRIKLINTLLEYAAKEGEIGIVKYLVERGANIHADGDYALRWASYKGHLEVVKYLVEKGANIHYGYDEALGLARLNGHLEVVKYLQTLP